MPLAAVKNGPLPLARTFASNCAFRSFRRAISSIVAVDAVDC